MRVSFPEAIRRSFTRTAKKAFPTEVFAVLAGRRKGDLVEVRGLVYPELISADADHICYSENVYEDVAQDLKEEGSGLVVVGDLHSHCWPDGDTVDASPSETDWDRELPPSLAIQGICCVTEYPNKQKRARYRFWPNLTPPTITK